ncbi:MAG TPA: YihY/virulence factor BrkB family protein [Allosphingosinicella sp.]|nr:YihY/virulence factor BrkB family protein [Allosphingosinicella sp.]
MAIESIKWPALPEWKQILVRTWKESSDDNVGLLAAGVAFYFFLAFVPLLASIVLTYGLIADPATVSEHIQGLARTLPQEVATIIGDQLQAITGEKEASHGIGLLIAIALAIYGASKGAGAIVTALNIAYEVEETRSFIKNTLVSLATTIGLVVMVLAAAGAASAIGFVEHLLPFSSPVVHVLLQIVSALLAVAVIGTGIALLYRYAPNRPDAPWAWVTPGSAAATILWVAATLGFGLYASNFGNYNATYGSLGGVVVFLTWLYLTSYVLLMGGELNSELERQQAGKNPAAVAAGAPRPEDATGAAPQPAKGAPAAAPRRTRTVQAPAPDAGSRPQRATGVAAVAGGAALALTLWRRLRRRTPPAPKHFHYPNEGGTVRAGTVSTGATPTG